jgi:hypothetical protein
MRYEAVVFYLHHVANEAMRYHLQLLRKHNAFPIVIAHCDDSGAVVPHEESIEIPKEYERGTNWHNADWIWQTWYKSRHRVEADRYIYLEWDCYADVPLKDWYADLWDADVVTSLAHRPPSNWYWLQSQLEYMPQELSSHATGLAPLNGVLLSRRAIEHFSQTALHECIFSELRLGSILAAKGFTVETLPMEKAINNVFLEHTASLTTRPGGFYHPVKSMGAMMHRD